MRRKPLNEKIDHYSKNQTNSEKKPETYKIIKKEDIQDEIRSNEKIVQDSLNNPINQLNEEEKHEEHKIIGTGEDVKTITPNSNGTKQKDPENPIIQIKKDEKEEEQKILESNNGIKVEIIDNNKVTKLQENKNMEELIKKNILLPKHDPSKDFYPN